MSKPASSNPTLLIGEDIIINRQGKRNYAQVRGFQDAMIDVQLYYNQADILSLLTGVKKWEQSKAIEILQFSNIYSDTYLLSNCHELIHPVDVVEKTVIDTPYCYDRDRNVVSYVGTGQGDRCNFRKMNQCNQILSEIKRKSIVPNDEDTQIWKYRQCLPQDSQEMQFLENDFDLIHQMSASHQAYISGLPTQLTDAIEYYTDTGSEQINSYLAITHSRRQSNEELETYIQNLREAINRAPPLPQPLIVYRGIRSKSYNDAFVRVLENSKVGDEIQLPDGGFISTSVSPKIALQFAKSPCCFIVIYLPKGTQGLFFGEDSSYTDEYEYLLSDQQRFRFFLCGQSMERITSSFPRAQQMNVYHVVAI